MSSRKERSISEKLKITSLNTLPESIQVGVLGSSLKPYTVTFIENHSKCSCPDFTYRNVVCKHIYFVINLAKNIDIGGIDKLEHIDERIMIIRENLLKVVEEKKNLGGGCNSVIIDRDECCSICMTEFQGKIGKCTECSHVFHIECLNGWWNLSSNIWTNNQGKCPYCRSDNGFSHINSGDAWSLFDFGVDNIVSKVGEMGIR